jgi:broad-specificity NMP kinase
MSGKKKGYKILMITGSPGAGKTLSTKNILSKMKYQVVCLNANIIKSVEDVQSIICS